MNTRPFQLTLGLAVALASHALAEEATDLKTAGYHLQKKSSFVAAQSVRSPFWPIGWTPSAKNSAPSETPTQQEFTLKPDQFSVTSILLGSQSLAVINGRTYGEGEFIRGARLAKPAEGAAPSAAAPASALPAGVKVRVMRIMDGEVTLQAGTQSVAVPLRRPQLSEKKPGEDEVLLLQAAADR